MAYEKEVKFAKELASEAGEIMRKYFNSDDINTELKEDSTPITIADTTINRMVIERVKAEFPELGILGEEESHNPDKKSLWIVDPIDGTAPYSLGIPVSTFSLAYVTDGETQVAVVYDPFQDRMMWAVKGEGAFLNGEKLKVSDKDKLEDAYITTGSTLSRAVSKRVRGNGVRIFDLYSFAYSGSQVACGRFVAAAMEYGSPWDPAAISLIVQEAGGKATDLKGNERKYNEWGDGILVSNGLVHDAMIEVLSSNE